MTPTPPHMMDYAAINAVMRELAPALVGGRLYRATSAGAMEIVLLLDSEKGRLNLLISADARASRIHLVDKEDIPKDAAKLHICNMLNERDRGATLVAIEPIPWERIVRFTFTAQEIDGTEQIDILVAELMGKHSNIILLNGNEMIIGSLKAIQAHHSRKRQVRPGLQYQLPPPEDKLTPKPYSLDDFASLFKSSEPDTKPGKLLVKSFKAMSPSWAGTIIMGAGIEEPISVEDLNPESIKRIHESYLKTLQEIESGNPLDIEPTGGNFPINQAYADLFHQATSRELFEKHQKGIMRIIRDLGKSSKKLAKQLEADLKSCEGRDDIKRKADAVMASINEIPKGAGRVELLDVYSPNAEKITIELDPSIPPAKQAAKWYGRYNKLKRGEAMARNRLKQVNEKLGILDEIKTEVENASGLAALDSAAARLEAAGIEVRLDRQGGISSKPSGRTYKVLCYRSSDGFDILAGGNQKANDYLTQRLADNEDIWLHAQKMPGSHVIVRTRKKSVPSSTLNEAAMIAAWHSVGREGSKVPVDYTKVKHLRKPPGAKAGYVTYKKQRTIRIDPDEERVKRLAIQDND